MCLSLTSDYKSIGSIVKLVYLCKKTWLTMVEIGLHLRYWLEYFAFCVQEDSNTCLYLLPVFQDEPAINVNIVTMENVAVFSFKEFFS